MPVNLAAVRGALEKDELEPFFQPLVELHTGRLAGFEVLARWPDPERGLILPPNFISLAEEYGFIATLMKQVMRKAFLSAPLLPEPLVLAVNVSPSQLQDRGLPDQIACAAQLAGFPLHRLGIEITESALANNQERALEIASELKALGCRLALDDFGTGYSSLRQLEALPFDQLKVDGSFVRSMTGTRESRKIVAAIIGLGQSLGMTTLAECVESEEQAEMLLCLGCEMCQGWLYGRPVPADQLAGIVAAAPQKLSPRLFGPGGSSSLSSLEALPLHRLAQLHAIYDGAPVGLCFVDRNLRYVSLNRRLAEMHGAPLKEHLGKTVQEMVPGTYLGIEGLLKRALEGESIPESEVTMPANRPGDKDRTVLVSHQPAWDEAGEVIGVSVAVVDITARKQAEEALRESEEHLRYMIELNPEVPWVMDAEGNNLDTSSRWTEITGLSKDQTRNRGWLDALHPEDVEPTMNALREALRSGKHIDVEYRVKRIDREWRWMRSRGAPRFGPTGEILRWYGSVEDIDARKQMEDALFRKMA